MKQPKKSKKSKPQPLPPLSAGDIIDMLHRDGWRPVEGTKHRQFEHPDRGGKVGVSMKWTGLRFGHTVMQSVMAQAGWTKDDVRRLHAER